MNLNWKNKKFLFCDFQIKKIDLNNLIERVGLVNVCSNCLTNHFNLHFFFYKNQKKKTYWICMRFKLAINIFVFVLILLLYQLCNVFPRERIIKNQFTE